MSRRLLVTLTTSPWPLLCCVILLCLSGIVGLSWASHAWRHPRQTYYLIGPNGIQRAWIAETRPHTNGGR